MNIVVIIVIFILSLIPDGENGIEIDFGGKNNDEVFRIISSTSTSKLDKELIDYGDDIGVDIEIDKNKIIIMFEI